MLTSGTPSNLGDDNVSGLPGQQVPFVKKPDGGSMKGLAFVQDARSLPLFYTRLLLCVSSLSVMNI